MFQFNYHEFMESWQQSVPDGMTTSLEQLAVSSGYLPVATGRMFNVGHFRACSE